MKTRITALALSFGLLALPPAHAQSEASALSALSMLPVASVVAAPVVLLTSGAVLVVKTIEVSARGTVYVLERASDGARVSIEIGDRAVRSASIATGTLVTCSVIGAGIVLSVAGEAIAFIPNALGQALLHNERLTH